MAFKFIAQKDYLTFENGKEYNASPSEWRGINIRDINHHSPNDACEHMWVPYHVGENESTNEAIMRVELKIIGDLMDAGVITNKSNLTTSKT